MSAKVVGLVLESSLPRPEKYLLILLADHAKEDGSDVYPSLLNMEWKLGYSERQLRRLLLSLEKKEVLELVHRGGGGPRDVTRYRIAVDRIPMLEPFRQWAMKRRSQGGQNVRVQGGHSEHKKADILSEKGGHFEQKKAVKMSVEPRTEPKTEPRTKEQTRALIAEDLARKVLTLRREKRSTDEARQQLGRALGTMRADAIEAFVEEVKQQESVH